MAMQILKILTNSLRYLEFRSQLLFLPYVCQIVIIQLQVIKGTVLSGINHSLAPGMWHFCVLSFK